MANGKIITFYSYKGGAGRSMALANVTWILALNGKKVLTIDWDLEAPGLHRYFLPFLDDPELIETRGIIDLFWSYADLVLTPKDSWPPGITDPLSFADAGRYAVPLEYQFPNSNACLHFLGAGRQKPAYAMRVRSFDWPALYARLGGSEFVEKLRERLRQQYDYILVDSRTRVADTSGICTIQMPDTVVLCFTYNRQSMKGVEAVAESILAQRGNEVTLLPVAMRAERYIKGYDQARIVARRLFEPLLRSQFNKKNFELYWKSCEVPSYPDYSFEETLAVFKDLPGQRNTLLSDMIWLTSTIGGSLTSSITVLELPVAVRENYLRQFALNATGGWRPLHEANLVLVGHKGVGKTSLALQLVHNTFEIDQQKAEENGVINWTPEFNGERNIQLNIWEFGRQEILHAPDEFSLTPQDVYLIVLNGSGGAEEADADYWLKLLENFGDDSPVIVVLNKIEDHPFDLDRLNLQSKYPNIRELIRTDCISGQGINMLRKSILTSVTQLTREPERIKETASDDIPAITQPESKEIDTSPRRAYIDSLSSLSRILIARRREEATVGLSVILFWLGYNFINWLPSEAQNFIRSWRGNLIIPGVLYVAGLIFLSYGIYRIWRLVYIPDLPPVTALASAVKGPLAFTPSDGALFRKLGREDELKRLLSYIEDDQISLVVLMGASGVGKTSLLRAGLTDVLRARNIKYHYWEAVSSDWERGLLRAIQESWHNYETSDGIPSAELHSLNNLINPPPAITENRHVIILDQFEQLRGNPTGQVFQLLKKVARQARPPHRITWVVAFRREFRADWSDFIIPEQERGFFPPELSLRPFTPEQAQEVINQLIQAAGLSVEQKVIYNLIEAATVEGEVSPVDIGIGLLVLSAMYERQAGKTVTEEAYHFTGGAEGMLTQYISRCLDYFSDEDRKHILSALLALRDPETNQRIAEGKTCDELAEEVKAESRRLKMQLERLTQRDMRLLERVFEVEEEEMRYRLPLDRLISALNRLAGRLLGESEEAKLKFANAFSAWKRHHAQQYLLRGKDLRLVERNQSKIPWGQDEQEKLHFLKRSQQHRILRRLVALALVIVLTASGWLANSQYQKYAAKEYLQEYTYPPELYDYQQQLKVLKLKQPFNLKRFPWLKSNTLEELSIKATSSTNSLEGLADIQSRCPSLKRLELNLSDSQISSIEILAKFTKLNQLTLNLSGTKVESIEALAKLPNLTQLTLDLDSTKEDSLEALAKLPSITQLSLYLRNSQVSSLEPLMKLTKLRHLTLDLSSSQVSSLETLAKFTNLDQLTLDLRSSQVSSLEPLTRLTDLTQLSLYLSGSRVSNLEPLTKLINVSQLTLDLSNSQVSSLEPLLKLNFQTIELILNTEQRLSLRAIPKSVTNLGF